MMAFSKPTPAQGVGSSTIARRPRLLLFGQQGQVGWELARSLAPLGDVRALDRAALDLTDLKAVRETVEASKADVIVNAAAYTKVDKAESEPELAMRVNGEMPAVLAAEAARSGALLVHYSTDSVFDGTARIPYRENDSTGPQTAYAVTKLRGEDAVLASAAEAYIFRIGWVYGLRGHNFLRTMQRLAHERDELRVVADQWGAPTWSRVVAEATVLAVSAWLTARRAEHEAPPRGLYHMSAPDYTSWHLFAAAIVEATSPSPGRKRPVVTPIATADYSTPAVRPAWSVLNSQRLRDEFGLQLPSWSEQMKLCLASLPASTV